MLRWPQKSPSVTRNCWTYQGSAGKLSYLPYYIFAGVTQTSLNSNLIHTHEICLGLCECENVKQEEDIHGQIFSLCCLMKPQRGYYRSAYSTDTDSTQRGNSCCFPVTSEDTTAKLNYYLSLFLQHVPPLPLLPFQSDSMQVCVQLWILGHHKLTWTCLLTIYSPNTDAWFCEKRFHFWPTITGA